MARCGDRRAGVDFNEVYAPMVTADSAGCGCSAGLGACVDPMDAVTAFLNAPMGFYVRVPEGFCKQPDCTLTLSFGCARLSMA